VVLPAAERAVSAAELAVSLAVVLVV